jgi:hypothetical protein
MDEMTPGAPAKISSSILVILRDFFPVAISSEDKGNVLKI